MHIVLVVILMISMPSRPSFTFNFDANLAGVAHFVFALFGALITTALVEEAVFRGYMGACFYGRFKHKFWAIFLIGFLFSIAHAYSGIGVEPIGFLEFVFTGMFQGNFSMLFLMHLIFHWLYARYNNIYGPILLHFLINFQANFMYFPQ